MCDGRDGSLRVLVENEGCGVAEHRCGKSISVYYQGGLITMQHREVTVHSVFIVAKSFVSNEALVKKNVLFPKNILNTTCFWG